MRRRSSTSASAPAGTAKRKAGAALAVCNNATSVADAVSDVISQAAATTCIHEPMLDASEATHSAKKTLFRSGSHVDAIRWGDPASMPACPSRGALLECTIGYLFCRLTALHVPCLLFGVALTATFGSVWVVPGLGFEGWCVTPAPVRDGRVLDHLGVNLAVGDGEAAAPFEIRNEG